MVSETEVLYPFDKISEPPPVERRYPPHIEREEGLVPFRAYAVQEGQPQFPVPLEILHARVPHFQAVFSIEGSYGLDIFIADVA